MASWAVKGGGGLPPMENASLSFAVAFDDEDDGSMVDGSTRGGTLTDDDMNFDPEGAAAFTASSRISFLRRASSLPKAFRSATCFAPTRGVR